MKQVLHNCGRTEVRLSPVEGYGVFATDKINKGEVLEETPFVLFPEFTKYGEKLMNMLEDENLLADRAKYLVNLRQNLKFKLPEKYYFKWSPPSPDLMGERIVWTVLPLGNGPIYNTSNSFNNASWRIDDQLFCFMTDKDIAKDEEIKTFYGYFIGEDSITYDVTTVFFHSLDRDKVGKIRTYDLRSAEQEHVQLTKTDPEYLKVGNAMSEADDGLQICSLQSIEADGSAKYTFVFPEDWNIAFTYKKINEFKRAKMPFTQITYKYHVGGKEKTFQARLSNR
jgi:hypothetical protein